MIKKQEHMILLIITVLFAGIIIGSIIGRYSDKTTVTLSAYDQTSSGTVSTEPIVQVINNGKLNINMASVKDLILLPGIGETYAQRIVDYRSENGPFMRIEDLLNVKGIGQKRIDAIAELITVGG